MTIFAVNSAVRISDLVFVLGVVVLKNMFILSLLVYNGEIFFLRKSTSLQEVTKSVFYVLLTVHLDIIG